jgi:hypothetical protein
MKCYRETMNSLRKMKSFSIPAKEFQLQMPFISSEIQSSKLLFYINPCLYLWVITFRCCRCVHDLIQELNVLIPQLEEENGGAQVGNNLFANNLYVYSSLRFFPMVKVGTLWKRDGENWKRTFYLRQEFLIFPR